MAFSINTNTASMEALASLRSTNAALTTTENQISTGKKVSSASDDPAIYAISQTMNSQISALSGVSTGLQSAAQVVSMASTQATSISSLLSNLSQSLTEGQTSGVIDTSTMNQTISKTLSQIDAAANGATFKGVNLLAGAVGNGVTATSTSAAQDVNGTLFTQSGFNATSSGLGLNGLSVNQAGVDVAVGTSALATGDSLSLQTTSVSDSADASATNVANKLTFGISSAKGDTGETNLQNSINNLAMGAAGGTAATGTAAATAPTTAGAFTFSFSTVAEGGKPTVATNAGYTSTSSVDSNGMTNMVFTNSSTGATQTLSYGADSSGNMTVSVSTGSDQNGNVTNKSTFVEVTTNSTDSGTTSVNKLMSAVENQGFGVSKDSSTGDLSIAGGNLDASNGAGWKVATTANGTTTYATATATAGTGSTYALLAVNAAITSMNKISSSLGSSTNELTGLQSTVSSLSDALTTGEGTLTDADLSAESAKLTSLQTKQQLAIQSLSIANSQSSSLMSLFR